jgi:hypothetical protein
MERRKPLISLVPEAGVEPAWYYVPRDFKSLASTNSATPAMEIFRKFSRFQLK